MLSETEAIRHNVGVTESAFSTEKVPKAPMIKNAAGILINLAYWFVAVMGIAIVVYALPGAEVPEPAAALLR